MENILTPEDTSKWTRVELWKDLCAGLTLSEDDKKSEEGKLPGVPKPSKNSELVTRLIEDGYALVDTVPEEKKERFLELTEMLKDGITSLHGKKLPATFILLYDETWEYAATHPSNIFNFDILAWYIDPKEEAAGFSPHRDRQPENALSTFHDDMQAKYVTMWTALSNATPENSCLYIIPRQHDPGYLEGDFYQDPLQRALVTKHDYQHIRALPRLAGQSAMFTHRILHWGSRGNPNASPEPRIAISFVCSDPDFEQPYVNPNCFENGRIPPFRLRLLLVCAQLIIYYQRFDLPKSCLRACHEYCKKYEEELDKDYRGKIGVEFVKAVKEAGKDARTSRTSPYKEEEENEQEEAILEEMLEAEEKGYGEFADDYDELNSNPDNNEDYEPVDDLDDDDDDNTYEGAFFGKRKDPQIDELADAKKVKL
jgi:hypothetical protein